MRISQNLADKCALCGVTLASIALTFLLFEAGRHQMENEELQQEYFLAGMDARTQGFESKDWEEAYRFYNHIKDFRTIDDNKGTNEQATTR